MTCSEYNLTRNGYIALTSVLIISIVIMAVTFTAALSGALNRFIVLRTEEKEVSSALASACVDMALLRLAQDDAYDGNETVPIGTETCAIYPFEHISGSVVIKTKASVQNAVTNLRVSANTADLSIQSWEEIPTL